MKPNERLLQPRAKPEQQGREPAMNMARHARWPGVKILLPMIVLVGVTLWLVDSAEGGLEGPAVQPPVAIQAQSGYVGQDTCLECHEEVGETIHLTVHARAELPEWAGAQGCEACHGPGQSHADSGDADLIRTFSASSVEDTNAACLTCHTKDAAMFWRGSAHESFDLSCTSCHSLHAPWTNQFALANGDMNTATSISAKPRTLVNQKISETCLTCHTEVEKSMFQRSNHPLRNGQMSCADCHTAHGSVTEASLHGVTKNETCYGCHAETRGPFLWAHMPVQEDCSTCHTPHGSNQTKLLKSTPPRLCQSCHLFGHHQTVPGTSGQVWNSNRSCVNCHIRIHGSNHASGILFMR